MLLKYLFVSICALLLIKITRILAVKLDLVDKPNIRKKHFFEVPLVGGLVFAFANLIIYSINDFSFSINKILVVSTIVAIIGFFDDKFELSVTKKIILLIIPIFITATDDLILTGLGNYKYFNDINFGSYAIICTVGAALLLVNATNYFDGSDGNLLTMFINSLMILIYLNFDNYEFRTFLSFLLLISLILIPFNLSIQKKIKIFSGNAGSLLVGFILSFCLIYSAEKYKIHPIILSFSVSVIIFDFLSVTISRLIKGKNIFFPDNTHIHHLLIKFFNSNIISLIILNLINLTLFAISLVFYYYINSLGCLLLFIFSFILFFFFRFYLTKYV
jgi:UDP-GlcNAc:undecaprenyl-phosphate GlcNAc-1-phosphate transferase